MENPVVRLISEGQQFTIGLCDGRRTIAQATDIFCYICPNFKREDIYLFGKATSEMAVVVGKIVEDANFATIFTSLSRDVRKLALTQDQILDFVENHKDWLCQGGWITLFLLESSSELFVVYMYLRIVGSGIDGESGLGVDIRPFGYVGVWPPSRPRRLIIPQLQL